MDDINTSIKGDKLMAIDFFCSAGGVTCGFMQAGIGVLGGIDIDESCRETYEKNNNAKFLNADVSEFPPESLQEEFDIDVNQDNLIFVGCSPCQYYSNIKTDKTKSEETRLLLEDFQEFVDYYRPGYVFVENVPGLNSNPESPLGKFKGFLEENGYVFDDGVLNAKYFETPQNRRRYVLLATRVRNSISLPREDKSNLLSIKDAIGDLDTFPPIPAGHIDNSDFKHSSSALKNQNLLRIKSTPKDGGDRRSWPQSLQPDCYRRHDGHHDVYGRMAWNKPSPTITTKFNSYSNGRYGHPEQDRAISLREGATLQSFPLSYKFYSRNQGAIAKMIGNAVPPQLAKAIGEQFKEIQK